MDGLIRLTVADYIVIAVVLLIPLAIGIFFAVRDANKATRDEYLLGGRRMAMVPVAMSLCLTHLSAIAMVVLPGDLYQYGPVSLGIFLGIVLAYAVVSFTVAPLMHPLQITSVYEYLEVRFESRAVRRFVSVVGMMQTFFYTMVALLAPGLALEAAAGIPMWLSVVIIGVTGTVYTCVGGFKGVVWADAFQTLVFLAGILLIVVKASADVGGFNKVMTLAKTGGRTDFGSFSYDPRVRYTWWGTTIGGFFFWMFNLTSQSTIQRISSLKTPSQAGNAMLLNLPLYTVFGVLLMMSGWCLYAYIAVERCDPFQTGLIKSTDQMVPFVVLHSLRANPGLSGLFLAALFSGSLSSLSSGINSLAANTMDDFLKYQVRNMSENSVTVITKLAVLIYGSFLIGVVYMAKFATSFSVVQGAVTLVTSFGSCVFGVFLLGCTIPWGNKYGAVSGLVVSICVSLWIMVGEMLYGTTSEKLPPVPSDSCFNSTFSSHFIGGARNHTLRLAYKSAMTPNYVHGSSSEFGFFLYDVSYVWHGFIGVLMSFLTGFVVSRVTASPSTSCPHTKLIVPVLRDYWNLRDVRIYGKYFDDDDDSDESFI